METRTASSASLGLGWGCVRRAQALIFIAYTLPVETASTIATWTGDSLGDAGGLRLVPADNLHVTLVFCGRLPAERVEEVVERTRAGIVVRRAPVFRLRESVCWRARRSPSN